MHFENDIKLLEKEYDNKDLSLRYTERDEFTSDASVSIKTKGNFETIELMFLNGTYHLTSSALNFKCDECTKISEVIDIIKHRIEYSLKINSTKSVDIDFKLLKKLESKYELPIKTLAGATIIEYAGFSPICSLEKEFMYLTIGSKTIEVPLSKAKETLDQLSQFNGIN